MADTRVNRLEQIVDQLTSVLMNQQAQQAQQVPPAPPAPPAPVPVDWARKVSQYKPDVFLGQEDPVVLEDWIRQMEKIFSTIACPDERQVRIAVFYFKGEADNWWSASKEGLLAQQGFDWDALKTALRARFYSTHVKKQKYAEFQALSRPDCRYERDASERRKPSGDRYFPSPFSLCYSLI
jgi:hypothetical protein